AFAEQVLGRVPAAVLGQEQLDELREGLGVAIDAVDVLLALLHLLGALVRVLGVGDQAAEAGPRRVDEDQVGGVQQAVLVDRKSTRLNSSHVSISYAVFCLKKKKKI